MSAILSASSICSTAFNTSEAIFLLSLIYCSNCWVVARPSASAPGRQTGRQLTLQQQDTRHITQTVGIKTTRSPPSTSTFTAPSGSFNNCRLSPTVPVPKTRGVWVLKRGFFLCNQNDLFVTRHHRLKRFDGLFTPTNNGTIMCGNTTMSRSGKLERNYRRVRH